MTFSTITSDGRRLKVSDGQSNNKEQADLEALQSGDYEFSESPREELRLSHVMDFLFDEKGLTPNEIADVLGCSASAVKDALAFHGYNVGRNPPERPPW